MLHRAERIPIEINQQLFSGKALARRHGNLVAAVPPNLHPVGNLSLPARCDLEPRGAFLGRHVSQQQAVARVAVTDHVIDRVSFRRD